MFCNDQKVRELGTSVQNMQLPDFRGVKKKETPFAGTASVGEDSTKRTPMVIPLVHGDRPRTSAKLLGREGQKMSMISHYKEHKIVNLSDVRNGKDSGIPGERRHAKSNKGSKSLPFPNIKPHGGLCVKRNSTLSSTAIEPEIHKLPPLDLSRYSKQSPHRKDVLFDPAKFCIAHPSKIGVPFKPPSVSDDCQRLSSDSLKPMAIPNIKSKSTVPLGLVTIGEQEQTDMNKTAILHNPERR